VIFGPWHAGQSNTHAKAFNTVPFAVGSLIGLRSWRTKDHMLTPTSMIDHTWEPGENHARCIPGTRRPPEEHRLVGMDCMCGFYAYFDGKNNYATSVTVSGIIEGYGRCVYGTQGFRCEKAIVRALVRPSEPQRVSYGHSEKNPVPYLDFDLLHSHYPDVIVFDTVEDALEAFPLTPKEVTEPES
jgi:hypothetical protein